MFLLNSRLGLFAAATSLWHPFSLSYGAFLPSSLTTLLPPACGFSPHLPVSVCGTGRNKTIAAFLDSLARMLPYFSFSPRHSSVHYYGFACNSTLLLGPVFPFPAHPSPPVSPQFCLLRVQESLPVSHRLRLSTSP